MSCLYATLMRSGEPFAYKPCGTDGDFCSPACKAAHKMRLGGNDYDFIADRLAIGNVASRAVPGFVAVVSLLSTSPWDELTGAPEILGSVRLPARSSLSDLGSHPSIHVGCIPILHINISDGETSRVRPDNGETYGNDLNTFLDDATAFIAAHIRRGCVLVHCGTGKSRSVAVVVAYLCRYAGMSLTEALSFVSARRPGACPAPCFIEAIKRWLRLDELTMGGPRR